MGSHGMHVVITYYTLECDGLRSPRTSLYSINLMLTCFDAPFWKISTRLGMSNNNRIFSVVENFKRELFHYPDAQVFSFVLEQIVVAFQRYYFNQ